MEGLLKSHVALFIVNAMYAANYVVAKGLMPDIIGPNGFIFLRVSGAVFLFWLVFIFNYQPVAAKDILRLAVCGMFGVAINQLFFFNGIMLTSPLNAPIIMTMTPILVLIMSVIILHEKVNRRKLTGIVIGAVGSILFTLLSRNIGYSTSTGDFYIILNAVSFSLYMVLVKPLMAKYRPLTVITWVFTFGLIYVSIWPFSLPEFLMVDFKGLKLGVIGRLSFVVVGVTFLTYLLTVYAMKRLSPSDSSIYIYFQPLLAALFIYLFYLFGLENYIQDFTWPKVLSALLIFIGVYLVIKPGRKIKEITVE